MVFASEILSKAFRNIPAVGGHLLRTGVQCKRYAGVEMGHALVGLQRILFQPEWSDLSAGSHVLWAGRHAAQLLSAALLHESVSSNQARLAAGPVRHPAGGIYSGYYLLCGKTPYGPGHYMVNVPARILYVLSFSTVIRRRPMGEDHNVSRAVIMCFGWNGFVT